MRWSWKLVVLATCALAVLGAGAASAQSTEQDVGACGNPWVDVADTGETFDFIEACEGHDDCYAEGGTEEDRRDCDHAFLDVMVHSCLDDWPDDFWRRLSCDFTAITYFAGVRLGGWLFYDYDS